MSEFELLTEELNELDTQVSQSIEKFELALRGRLNIPVRAPFLAGHLCWMKNNGAWQMMYDDGNHTTRLQSTNRLMRVRSVQEGFPAFLTFIVPTLQEHIIERRIALQAFSDVEKQLAGILK